MLLLEFLALVNYNYRRSTATTTTTTINTGGINTNSPYIQSALVSAVVIVVVVVASDQNNGFGKIETNSLRCVHNSTKNLSMEGLFCVPI